MAQKIPHLSTPQINVPARGTAVRSRSGRSGSAGQVNAYLPHSPSKPINVSNYILAQGSIQVLGSAAKGFINYRDEKAEIARRAAVLEQRPIINAYVDKIKNDFMALKGVDASGIPQKIAAMKTDIYDELIPADSDPKTRNDLLAIVNSQYDKFLSWGHTYEVAQFDLADKIGIETIGNKVDAAAVKLPPGSDIREVHGIILKAMGEYEFMHPDVTPERTELLRESLVNRATSVMMQSWMVEAPGIAESYFNKHKDILRVIMKADFPRIAKQMDSIGDEARIDRAIATALKATGGNKAEAAGLFGEPEWLRKHMSDAAGVDYTGAISVQNTLLAQADSNDRRVIRVQNQKEDEAYTKILKDYVDPKTGNIDYANAIPALHKSFRLGEINPTVYERSLKNWTQSMFTAEDRRLVFAGIRSGELDSYAKISSMMKGNESVIQYTNYLDKVNKAKQLNKKIDYYDRSEKYWDILAAADRGKEGTYVMPIEAKEDFMDELTESMIANGHTYLDREVLMTAREMLLATSKYDNKLTVYPPGEYPSDYPFGAEYGRQWQYRDYGTYQSQKDRGEGIITPPIGGTAAIDSAPEIQTATSGNAIDRDQEAIDLIIREHGESFVNPSNIAIAKDKIADDKRVAEEAKSKTEADSGRPSSAVAAEPKAAEPLNEAQIKLIKEAFEDESISEDERRQLQDLLKKIKLFENLDTLSIIGD